MSRDCIDPQDLGRVRELPAEHPDARHVPSCPRCRSLMRAYEEFRHEPPTQPDGSDLTRARHELDARLAAVLAETPRAGTSRTGRIVSLRPWMAAAAVLVVALGISIWQWRQEPVGSVLRGVSASDPSSTIQLQEPVREGDTWTLRWTAVHAADAYEVRVFSGAMEEVARFGPLEGIEMMLTRTDLDNVPRDAPLYWRVTALVAGDPLMHSSTGVLP